MPRGAKDWGQYAEQDILTKTFDLGELAVRLGCPSVFSRSGSIIYATNFENGFKDWDLNLEGGCSIHPTVERGYYASYSLVYNLYGGQNARGIAERVIPFLHEGRYAFEIVFGVEHWPADIRFTCLVTSEGVIYYYAVYLLGSTSTLEIEKPGEDLVLETNIDLTGTPFRWNFMKLYFDTVSHEYLRLQLNNKVYNLKNLECLKISAQQPNLFEIYVDCTNLYTGANRFYVGSIILTANEE